MAINEVKNNFLKLPTKNITISKKTIGQQKDLILEMCLEFPNEYASIFDFKRVLFPKNSEDEIKYLLGLIIENNSNIIEFRKSSWDLSLASNENTKPFIDSGGFSKIESDLAISIKKKEVKESLESDIKALQKDNYEYLYKIRKQNDRIRNLEEQIKLISVLKLYWWLIPTCISIGIILAKLWTLLVSLK